MKRHPVLFVCFFVLIVTKIKAENYYINAVMGKDENSGTSQSKPWQSLLPLDNIKLQPGDSILFASGQQFSGMLRIVQVSGTATRPIVVTSYQADKQKSKPRLDAANQLYAIYIQNASFIRIEGLELSANQPYEKKSTDKPNLMRCGILVEQTQDDIMQHVAISDVLVHHVYLQLPGYKRSAAETKTANGTEGYGWGIRFINNTKKGQLNHLTVAKTEIYNVSHTGLKFTANKNGINNIEVANSIIHDTGGPGLQMSGVNSGHVHHNHIHHSGSTADSRNWGRGSGMWTWGSSNILIEHNRFENANGPGDSAGIHIDYNCNDVVVQYNLSANNAGGFCEILGNNYNCAYRYNISVNDGFREKGVNGAFQEGKVFWLSGYQGDKQKKSGPYNSYFYNNTMYISKALSPKVAVTSSARGVLIANNIFYFESAAKMVAGDQKAKELEQDTITAVVFENNLYRSVDNWPDSALIKDSKPVFGDPGFKQKGSTVLKDYKPTNTTLVKDKGIEIKALPGDSVGLKIGLKVQKDILGNQIKNKPDFGAIEIQ